MATSSIQNPVWSGYCADPYVFRHGEFYYCCGTYFVSKDTPEIACPPRDHKKFVLLRSGDLSHWEYLGGAMEPVPGVDSEEYWAPEIAFSQNRFWLYYSCLQPLGDSFNQRLRVAVADVPQGPYRDCGKLLFPQLGFTIDASPFRDPRTGQWYLYFSKDDFEGRPGTGTAVVALNDDMVTAEGAIYPVVLPSADWQISGRNWKLYGRTFPEWHTVEGAHVVFHEGRYYCFYSGGNWMDASYGVAYAVAEHPLGPWLDAGTTRGACVLKGDDRTIGPGHNSIVRSADGQSHLCAYHAWDSQRIARQLCLDPVHWTPYGPKVYPSR